MTRAAIYVRVSTDKQHAENQLPELQALAERRGFKIVGTYSEVESAKKRRPVFDSLIADATARRFDVVLVWALDRLQRSQVGAMMTVHQLDKAGVAIVSAREPWLDTTGPVRSLLVSIFGWVAEQEHARIVERTKLGLAAARARGSKLGRPPAAPGKIALAVEAVRERGFGAAKAARVAGVGAATLRRELQRQGFTRRHYSWIDPSGRKCEAPR